MNRVLLRQAHAEGRPLPALYDSGVKFAKEPRLREASGRRHVQGLVDLRVVLRRGWGDCKHLCAWRVAELNEGEDPGATIKIYWRVRRLKGQLRPYVYHAEVRRSDGSVEDPSRYLGM